MSYIQRRSLLFLCLGIFLLLPLPLQAGDDEMGPRELERLEKRFHRVARTAAPRTVGVRGAFGMGTGAIIDEEGLVITNAHVAALGRIYHVVRHDGRVLTARRLWVNYGRDLALLRLPEGRYPAFDLRDERPEPGDWVVGLGHPGGVKSDAVASFGAGVVSAEAGDLKVMGVLSYKGSIKSDVPLFPGNSGGPLVDLRGRLVGVNGAVELTGGVSYSIPAADVEKNVKRNREGEIVLPSGQRFNPEEIPGLSNLLDRIDDVNRRMLEGGIPRPDSDQNELGEWLKQFQEEADEAMPEARIDEDPIVERARKTVRNRRLLSVLDHLARGVPRRAVFAVNKGRGGLATVIGSRHAVCKASLVRGDRVRLASIGEVAVVDRHEGHDLALLRLPADADVQPVNLKEEGPVLRVGDVVYGVGENGPFGGGVVSAYPRTIDVGPMDQAQGAQTRVQKAFVEALKRLGGFWKPLRDWATALEKSMEARERYMGGNRPRDYPLVIQHDVPTSTGDVGGPLLDRRKRVVGITVGHAHYGTNYAVPAREVRAAFRTHLEGKKGRGKTKPRKRVRRF